MIDQIVEAAYLINNIPEITNKNTENQISSEIINLHARLKKITDIFIVIIDSNHMANTNAIKEQTTLLLKEIIPPAIISTNHSLIGEKSFEKSLTIILMIGNIVKGIE